MAFGFPANYTETSDEFSLGNDFRKVLHRALRSLRWPIRDESQSGITASVRGSAWSWGERITIRFCRHGHLSVTSSCVLPTQCLDWGKNKRNVRKLLVILRKTLADDGGPEP